MMNRFETLERKSGEKMTAYWSRFNGFYEDNRIKKDDKLKQTATNQQRMKRSADSARAQSWYSSCTWPTPYSQRKWHKSSTTNSKIKM